MCCSVVRRKFLPESACQKKVLMTFISAAVLGMFGGDFFSDTHVAAAQESIRIEANEDSDGIGRELRKKMNVYRQLYGNENPEDEEEDWFE